MCVNIHTNENITVNVLWVSRFAQKNITLNMRHSLYRYYSGMNLFFQKYEKPLHAQYVSSNKFKGRTYIVRQWNYFYHSNLHQKREKCKTLQMLILWSICRVLGKVFKFPGYKNARYSVEYRKKNLVLDYPTWKLILILGTLGQLTHVCFCRISFLL